MVAQIAPLGARRWLLLAGAAALIVAAEKPAQSQDLGHKLMGTLGLDAGRAPEPGLYLMFRLSTYRSDQLRNRDGDPVPTGGLRLRLYGNAVGVAGAFAVPGTPLRLAAAVAAPLAFAQVHTDAPEARIDLFGLADLYLQPVVVGLVAGPFEVVASYSLYWPTGLYVLAGGSGLSAGQVTHQFSGGGTLFVGAERRAYASALASYELNMRKRGIDITRGDSVQIQGGLGARLFQGLVDAGLAGFALWQVSDDRGADLPAALKGARDRAYGLGPEVAVAIPPMQGQLRLRFEADLDVRARPQGYLVLLGLDFAVWRPSRGDAPKGQRVDGSSGATP